MGYLCAFVPVEIIAAAGLVPFRIKGDVGEPITRADGEMETIVCPLVRSCFDTALKERYGFIEGVVIPHACDSMCRGYGIWQNALELPYSHLINTPHGTDDSSLEFHRAELETLRRSLGRYAGRDISDGALRQAIALYNQYRAKVAALYQLRRASPPLISGVEVTRVLVAAMSLPVAEAIVLIDDVIAEAKARGPLAPKTARLMVVGAQLDSTAFIELIEDGGAWVVADDLCPGGRESLAPVDGTAHPIDALAERYLRRVYCGRTYRETKGSAADDAEERFGHIGRALKEYGVNGVVLYIYKYCDPFGFEVPQIKAYIESQGVPVLYVEDEYSMSSIGRLRTRIEAFLEMLGAK
jgi:benzoyl-CoA reductase/2-hydroxyglutaryl-CoA dehydratase subunit BcrC/BadD/HgdB